MNHNKELSTAQLLILGVVLSFVLAAVASAAPAYRGRFSLPYEVRWGQAVLPASEYLLRFVDVGTRVFVMIQDAKSGQDIALVAASSTRDATGPSALLLADDGGQLVVHSLRLHELGITFIYEPALLPSVRQVAAGQATHTLPVLAANE
jgi:hypothetical protein